MRPAENPADRSINRLCPSCVAEHKRDFASGTASLVFRGDRHGAVPAPGCGDRGGSGLGIRPRVARAAPWWARRGSHPCARAAGKMPSPFWDTVLLRR